MAPLFRMYQSELLAIVRGLLLVAALWPMDITASGPATAGSGGWQTLLTRPMVHHPTGIAIDLRGKRTTAKWAYVADAGNGHLVKFGTRGRVLGSWRYTLPGEHSTGAAVAVGGSGNVFVADPVAGTVSKFTPTGRRLARWVGFTEPQSIVVAPSGTIYLAETEAHRITALSPTGEVIKRWDTAGGFLQEYTVPPMPSGPLGSPTNVALELPDALFVATRCLLHVSCTPSPGSVSFGNSRPAAVDGLLTLRISGIRVGYLGDWWFGLGHALDGAPQQSPAKESRSFVTIDRLTSNRHQRVYLAGELWVLGRHPTRGVLTSSSLGSPTVYWPLASRSPVAGIAVDGLGRIYVAQDHRVLRLDPAKTPGQPTPYGG